MYVAAVGLFFCATTDKKEYTAGISTPPQLIYGYDWPVRRPTSNCLTEGDGRFQREDCAFNNINKQRKLERVHPTDSHYH